MNFELEVLAADELGIVSDSWSLIGVEITYYDLFMFRESCLDGGRLAWYVQIIIEGRS